MEDKTVTFQLLGNMGQLGNQMFQIAACIGIAHRENRAIHLPNWHYSQFFRTFFTEPVSQGSYTHHERGMVYQEIPDLTKHQHINLRGFFQSESYFGNIGDVIQDQFTLNEHYSHIIQDKFNSLIESKENREVITIGVHVRRGDYLVMATQITGIDYYIKAFKKLQEKLDRPANDFLAIIISDDPEWCKENLGVVFPDMVVSSIDPNHQEDKSIHAIIDMSTLSKCDHQIISNSTFSWWAAWLNVSSDKIIIAPKFWFNKDENDTAAGTLIPSDWIRL